MHKLREKSTEHTFSIKYLQCTRSLELLEEKRKLSLHLTAKILGVVVRNMTIAVGNNMLEI